MQWTLYLTTRSVIISILRWKPRGMLGPETRWELGCELIKVKMDKMVWKHPKRYRRKTEGIHEEHKIIVSVKTSLQGKNWSHGDAQSQKRITKKILTTFRRKILVPLELADLYARGGDLFWRAWNLVRERKKLRNRLFVLKGTSQGILPFAPGSTQSWWVG